MVIDHHVKPEHRPDDNRVHHETAERPDGFRVFLEWFHFGDVHSCELGNASGLASAVLIRINT